MPKGKKRVANPVGGSKPKRRRVAQSEPEVERCTFIDLPVELCNEVFNNLDASALLRMARVNKSTRSYLMRASMSKVWCAAAKRESADIPECPEGITLPGWLSLILEKYCRLCGANGVRKVMWEFKTRACKDCLLESPVFRRVPAYGGNPELDLQKLQNLLPYSYIHVPAHHPEPQRYYSIFLEADVEEFLAKDAEGGEAYTNWVNERAWSAKSNYRLHVVYSGWYSAFEEDRKNRRYQEAAQLRRNQIKSRLGGEGWMNDLQVLERDLARGSKSRFKDHPLFAKGGPLRDNEWKGIRHHILGMLKDEGMRMEKEQNQPRKAKRARV